ncbi:helix-turn-helix transcriptional regulator [Rhodococcus qingshengii]|uniref:Helix-turn-helix transcriptional regulator n=1 Tax=Rhodococcus qingshengii TaxID=334542 RepID=A0AAW6LS15_RHOSG|nr:helix-turn-helix transcriptional regulator [Rhodococcus qingshengii]MDE8649484.1 helix-turn-helix transcriptional regulator [Rhodococcus qingshengii]
MIDPAVSLASVGDAVRDARRERGWSQTQLGEEAGVSRPTIARIERGDDVSVATLAKVTAAVGLTVKIEPAHRT